MRPSPVALLSVGAEKASVEVDLDLTGLVYISVWAFSRGGEGPPVVLSEWEWRLRRCACVYDACVESVHGLHSYPYFDTLCICACMTVM